MIIETNGYFDSIGTYYLLYNTVPHNSSLLYTFMHTLARALFTHYTEAYYKVKWLSDYKYRPSGVNSNLLTDR